MSLLSYVNGHNGNVHEKLQEGLWDAKLRYISLILFVCR